MAISSYEDAEAAAEEAAARAAMLRKQGVMPEGQMVGKWYVKPHWSQGLGAALNQAMAGMSEREARDYKKQARQLMQQGAADWMASRPQGTTTQQVLQGPQQAEGMQDQPLLGAPEHTPPTQAEQLAWVGKGMSNPLTKALAAHYGEDVLIKQPEREAARVFKSDEAKAQREQKYLEHTERLEQTAKWYEMQAAMSANNLAQRAELEARADATRRELAAAQNEYKQQSLDFQREKAARADETKRYGIDARLAANANNKNKLSTKAIKELEEADTAVAGIDLALSKLGKIQDSAAGSYLRGAVTAGIPGGERLARAARSKEDSAARQTAFDIAGAIMHDRYGTALSKQEKGYAAQYLPSEYDDAKTIATKLAGLKELMTLSSRRLKLMEKGDVPLEDAVRAYPGGKPGVSVERVDEPVAAPASKLPPGVTITRE